MSPATGDYLLFLSSMRHRRGQPVYDAIDLTPWAEHQPDEGWFGWLAAGEAPPEPVKVIDPPVRIAHISGEAGSYWTIDGERIPDMNPIDRLRARVETRCTVGFTPPRVVPLPAFVSRNKLVAPRVHQVVVRLADRSLASFADAFLDMEVMEKTKLINDATLRAMMSKEFIQSQEADTARRWQELRRDRVVAGTMVPAEVATAGAAAGCVVRLDREAEAADRTTFRSTLFVARDVPVEPGALLRRRSGKWPPGRPPRLLERVVGRVLSAGPAEPLPSVTPDTPPQAPRAWLNGLDLRCLSCGVSLPGHQFDAEALEVAELTAIWHRDWKELALLRRTAALYQKHPEARDCVNPGATWIMDSEGPVVLDQVMKRPVRPDRAAAAARL